MNWISQFLAFEVIEIICMKYFHKSRLARQITEKTERNFFTIHEINKNIFHDRIERDGICKSCKTPLLHLYSSYIRGFLYSE